MLKAGTDYCYAKSHLPAVTGGFRYALKALFKGYNLLWKDMRYVREVTFETFEPLRLGVMG